jgi:F-type H+-transporting ATPase subunit c
MDLSQLVALGYPIGLGLAAIGSGLGLGRAVGGAMEAMGRQPEAIGKIQIAMIIGAAFIEALTIYALISIYLVPKPWAEQTAPAAVEQVAIEHNVQVGQAPAAIAFEDIDVRV